MELENYTLNSPRLSALALFGCDLVLGRCPRLNVNTAPLALKQFPKRFAGQSVDQPRLHHVNIDLGNVGPLQL